ncbi:hypothetical protein [Phytobacter diazotrophicus]|uniref:hypothetical protein n=1 Tax=Phytobacter diazotrophicus TaxID=395631 RepID=UPI002935393E|nr:hypothetical protein [Phytobacter diazotrophicus]MDV2904160.1 hypothetical protein [Phytobacter diazotrophicus]
MSGSGGGGGYNGQYGDDDFEIACEKLTFITQLSSPQAHVVNTLTVGDILGIMQQVQGGQSVTVAVFNGNVAGGIASPKVRRMRVCISNGTTYLAKVLSINGGQVQVQVYAI